MVKHIISIGIGMLVFSFTLWMIILPFWGLGFLFPEFKQDLHLTGIALGTPMASILSISSLVAEK